MFKTNSQKKKKKEKKKKDTFFNILNLKKEKKT